MPGETTAHELRLDLTGLAERYVQPPQALSPRARRVLLVLLVVAVLVGVVGLVRALLEDDLVHLVLSLLPALLVQLTFWVPSLPALQPQTRLSAEELDVRTDLVRREQVPWGRVVRVHAAGRWEDAAHAELADGRRLPLPHVPPEDVRRLGEALAATRSRRGTDEERSRG